MSPPVSDERREHLKAIGAQPGEVRNPKGINGWTKMREMYRDRLEPDVPKLQEVLVRVAMTGDVQALRLALGPIVDVHRLELTGEDGAPIDFTALARKAREEDT